MEYIKSFFSYFFTPNPGTDFSYYIPVLTVAVVLILGSILFSQYYKRKKKTDFAFKRLFKKVSSRMLLFGILFLVLTALRYESIPYFSMRFLLYLTAGLFLYFIYSYIKIYTVKYPKEKENAQAKHHTVKKEENQYLPNKKKK
jgi:Ca2+/Na+ antiporter